MRAPSAGEDLVELAASFIPGTVMAELYTRDPDPTAGGLVHVFFSMLRWLFALLQVKRKHQSRVVLVAVTPDRVAVLGATTSDGVNIKVNGIEDTWMRENVRAGVDDDLTLHLVAVRGKPVDLHVYPFVQSAAAREIAHTLRRGV